MPHPPCWSTHTGVQQCYKEEEEEDEQAQVQEVEEEVSFSEEEARQMITLSSDR